MDAILTVILTCFRRRHNLSLQLDELERQSARSVAFLWNNSPYPVEDSRIAWTVHSTPNAYCWPRWYMAAQARTKFVAILDDDLVPASPLSLIAAIAELDGRPKRSLVGVEGVILRPGAPYHPLYPGRMSRKSPVKTDGSIHIAYPAAATKVDVVKGRFICTRTAALAGLPLCPAFSDMCDDIAVSALLADGRRRFHTLLGNDLPLFRDLAEETRHVGLSSREDWRELRTRAKLHYWR